MLFSRLDNDDGGMGLLLFHACIGRRPKRVYMYISY